MKITFAHIILNCIQFLIGVDFDGDFTLMLVHVELKSENLSMLQYEIPHAIPIYRVTPCDDQTTMKVWSAAVIVEAFMHGWWKVFVCLLDL